MTLQKKHQRGGYALVSPKSGKLYVFGNDVKALYQKIEKEKINDSDKMVMYVPPLHVKHVF